MPISAYQTPGIYMEEVSSGARPIQAVGTSTAGFLGVAPKLDAYLNQAVPVDSFSKFVKLFVPEQGAKSTPLSLAVKGFFDNGGSLCYVINLGPNGNLAGTDRPRTGIKLLEEVDDISIVAAPGYFGASTYDALLTHCEGLKYRVAILDVPGPKDFGNFELLKKVATVAAPSGKTARSKGDNDADNKDKGQAQDETGYHPRISEPGMGAVYFPWLVVRDHADPACNVVAPPSGHLAGIWARTDATRGVHKAPANEIVSGALGLTYNVTDPEQAELNPLGINCIRRFNEGIFSWGARTIADSSSNWRYLNVRRLFNMVEESILRSTRWIVFEPNNESLWKAVKRDVSDFLRRVWRDGALMGTTEEQAFFVKCDHETNPPEDIDAGIVTILVGMAPVKPAEFVVFRIGQHASGSTVETL